MDETEFKNKFLPVLAARWSRMVGRVPKNATEFQIAAAKETNHDTWEILGQFDVDQAIEAARQTHREHPTIPDGKGYSWIKHKIREKLQGTKFSGYDPARWTWMDELDLWHQLTNRAKARSTGIPFGRRRGFNEGVVLGQEWEDELFVARACVGKTPSIEERDCAYEYLCRMVNEVRARMKERSYCTDDEIAAKVPYPRDAYWIIRHKWSAAAYMLAAREAEQTAVTEIAGLLEAME